MMVRIITFTLYALLINAVAYAQEGFVQSPNENWLVHIDEAYKVSKATNKPILVNFTGSDWCGWCIKLKREVFATEEFEQWANDNVVLLELDFPRQKQLPEKQQIHNASLQQAFKVRGYPTIWLFDLEKSANKKYQLREYGKTGYARGGPEVYTKNLEKMLAKRKK